MGLHGIKHRTIINEEGSHVRGCLFVKIVSCVMEESVYGIFGGSFREVGKTVGAVAMLVVLVVVWGSAEQGQTLSVVADVIAEEMVLFAVL